MGAFPPHREDPIQDHSFLDGIRRDVCSVQGKPRFARFLLRLGLGGIFLLFGIDKLPFRTPQAWTSFIPAWLADALPLDKLDFISYVIGPAEILIGAALLVGFLVRPAAFAAAVMLAGIVGVSGFTDLAIRDAGLLAMALALLFLGGSKPKRRH